MQKPHDNSKVCRTAFVLDSTLVVVIEMSLTSWLVAGMIPGVDREELKKIAPDPKELLRLLYRWRDEAIKAGRRSRGFRSRMRPDGIVFGWPVGCGLAALMLT
jgi:transposase